LTDKQKAIEHVMSFLRDKTKKTLLVKGHDEYAKLRVVLSCLNKKFSKGIIRTSSMRNISREINRSLGKDFLPNSVTSTTKYRLGRMTVKISSYATHTKSNSKGNEDTFTLFYPVQTVLEDAKRYSEFLNEIKVTESSKVILLTVHDHSIEEWDIENHVDEVFFYSVESDNSELMSNMRHNGLI